MLLPLPRTPCPLLVLGISTHLTLLQEALEETPLAHIEHLLRAPTGSHSSLCLPCYHSDYSGLSLSLVALAASGLEAVGDQGMVSGHHETTSIIPVSKFASCWSPP